MSTIPPILNLWSAVDNQGRDHTRHPTNQGEQRGDHNRTAALVDHRQGRKDDTDKNS